MAVIRLLSISAARAHHGQALLWLLLLLILSAGAAWWYFWPNTLPASVKQIAPLSPKAAPTLYKWRDGQGQLHVTDTPPKDRPYETVQYDPNTNVVPSVVPPSTDNKR